MKQSKFLKATLVASILIVNTFPLIAAETVKESITKSIHSAGEEIEDSAITSKVKIALLIHRSTATVRTEVITKNAVVALYGTVQNDAEKELITKLVEDIHGVKAVQNKMTIAKLDTKPSVVEKIEDSVITSKVKMALVLNRSTSASRTTVSTTDSVVTVSGIAKNNAEKELVTKVVEDVEGVNSVVNNMTVEQ